MPEHFDMLVNKTNKTINTLFNFMFKNYCTKKGKHNFPFSIK